MNFPALILAGGLGTRLRSIISDVPKPLAPVCGRPFITHLLDRLVQAGFQHAILCLGYKADVVRQTLGDKYQSLTLDYSVEPEPLGTGGAARLALDHISTEYFLLLNGDSYCDAPLTNFIHFHESHQQPVSLTAVQVPDTSAFGRLEISPENRLLKFSEKGGATGPGWINAGIYLIATSLLAGTPARKNLSLERDLFPLWLPQGLMAWKSNARFIDIGTPESYAQAEAFLIKK